MFCVWGIADSPHSSFEEEEGLALICSQRGSESLPMGLQQAHSADFWDITRLTNITLHKSRSFLAAEIQPHPYFSSREFRWVWNINVTAIRSVKQEFSTDQENPKQEIYPHEENHMNDVYPKEQTPKQGLHREQDISSKKETPKQGT